METNAPESVDEYVPENEYPRAAPILAAITFVLFLLMMALLGYRWLSMGEPNGFILVSGSKDFDGAIVSVTDPVTSTELHRQLTSANNYQLRFPLAQGAYQVSVSMDDKTVMKNTVSLREGNGVVFNLNQNTSATTQPTQPTQPTP